MNDQDGEVEITVIDKTVSVEEFFHFPPISKYAGDERISFVDIQGNQHNISGFDVIVHDNNFIDDTQRYFDHLEQTNYEGRIIILSTWEVYGWKGRRQIPFDEEKTSLEPVTKLGQTKKEIENIALSTKLNVVIFRLSMIFGPYMPEDSELIGWLRALLTQKPILVHQPAARAYDLCYITNVLGPIQKAFLADLPQHSIINLGSADIDYKKVREAGKDVEKPQIFEKHVVEALVGLRVLLDSRSKIEISNEGISEFAGKGFHSQLKTERARKLLDYYPLVDTMRGCLQTSFWLQKTMEIDQATMGRAIEDIYPTLDDKKFVKVGEEVKSSEVEQQYQDRKRKEKESKAARNQEFVCRLCDHAPTNPNPSKTNPDDLDEECPCDCHRPYKEET